MKASWNILFLLLGLSAPAMGQLEETPVPAEQKHKQAEPQADPTAEGAGPFEEWVNGVKSLARQAADTVSEARKKLEKAAENSQKVADSALANPAKSLTEIKQDPMLEAALAGENIEGLELLLGKDRASQLMNLYAFQKDFEKFYGTHIADIKAGKIPQGTAALMEANTKKHAVAAREISERTGEKPELVAFRLQRIQNLIDQSKSADAGKAMSSLMSTLRDRQELSATLKSKAGDYSLTPYFERATAKELGLHDAKKKDAAALRAAASRDDAFTQAFGEHWQKEALPRMKRFNDWVRDGKPDDKAMIAEFGKPESWGTWAVGARNTPALMRAATGAEGADGLRTLSASYFTGSGDKRSFTFKNEAELSDFMNHVNSTFEKAKLESKDKTVQFSAVVKTQLDAMPKPEIPLTATIPLNATAMANAIASGFARGLKPPPVRMAAVMGKSDADYGGAGETHCEGGVCTAVPPGVDGGAAIANQSAMKGAYGGRIQTALGKKDYPAVFKMGSFYDYSQANRDKIDRLVQDPKRAEELARRFLNDTDGKYRSCPSCWLGTQP